MNINYSSISQFQQLVELKDYRPATKKEYVRYVRKLAEHFQCDPATLTENQVREYFLFLRQHKHYKRAAMKAAKFSLLLLASLSATLAVYHFFVRRFAITRFCVGMKLRPSHPRARALVHHPEPVGRKLSAG